MSKLESKILAGQEELGFKEDWHTTFEDYSDAEKEIMKQEISKALADKQQLSQSQRKFERLRIEYEARKSDKEKKK